MTGQTLDTQSEVGAFVARVQALMADLPSDERQELTAGLEADLAELVSEQGSEALGDPGAYARELRTAAGHAPTASRVVRTSRLRQPVSDVLDAAHVHWDHLLDAFPAGGPRPFLTILQPVWWVLRGWIVWMVFLDATGGLLQFENSQLVAIGALVVGSVQLGRRSWGLDRLLRASLLARMALLALNIVALLALPGAMERTAYTITEKYIPVYTGVPWYEIGNNDDVITYQGEQACTLQVRDAAGNPIDGAYVWDLTGNRPLPMNNEEC